MLRRSACVLFTVAVSLGAGCSSGLDSGQRAEGLNAPATTSGPVVGDVAVWDLEPDATIEESTVEFTALVARLGCNGGETGFVFAPVVELADSEVVITFTVEPTQGGECPENDRAKYRIQLDEPIGNRPLIDGACLPGAEAATTAFCSNGKERWSPREG